MIADGFYFAPHRVPGFIYQGRIYFGDRKSRKQLMIFNSKPSLPGFITAFLLKFNDKPVHHVGLN